MSDFHFLVSVHGASQVALVVKNMRETQDTHVPSLGQEDPLEEDMATHSSVLAWKIPWTVTNKTRLNHFH